MSGMHGFWLTDSVLSTLDQRTKCPVAYIDESYREPLRNDERPFYTMSAVIGGRDQPKAGDEGGPSGGAFRPVRGND